MSVVSQFFTTPTTQKKQNRRIFLGETSGPTSNTWRVPPGVTEVEVHVWGGGGNSPRAYWPDGLTPASGTTGGGGGGGGYVTHVYPVSTGDVLSLTIGGPAGTSSVTVPTQSPGSPISATGGSPANTLVASSPLPLSAPGNIGTSFGGAGGSGSFSIAPGISTARTFAANGGSGGKTVGQHPGSQSSGYWGNPTFGYTLTAGGGGGAGFIYGPGGNGGERLFRSTAGYPDLSLTGVYPGPGGLGCGGGGIKGSGGDGGGGGFLPAPGIQKNTILIHEGGAGISGNSSLIAAGPSGPAAGYAAVHLEQNNEWFYLSDVKAIGSSYIWSQVAGAANNFYSFPAVAGGGASGTGSANGLGSDAGLWGGGGGGTTLCSIGNASKAGYGGGAGGGWLVSGQPQQDNLGGAGIIIIYW